MVLYHLGLAIASPKYFGEPLFAVAFGFGDAGVIFFFVLSGFIITRVHCSDLGHPTRFLAYARKRTIRIYPTYWFVLVTVFLAAIAVPALRSTVPHDFPTLLKTVALIPQDPSVAGGTGAPILIVAWSLQYEICFYGLMGLFILNRPMGFFVSLAVLANTLACRGSACEFPRSFLSNPFLLLFAFGALIARLSVSPLTLRRPAPVTVFAGCAFVALGVAEILGGRDLIGIDRRLTYGLVSGLLIFSLVRAEDAGVPLPISKEMSVLGDSSYALYLIHFPLISVLCKIAVFVGLRGPWGALVAYLIILASCIVAAVALHRWVERPMLRFLSDVTPKAVRRHRPAA